MAAIRVEGLQKFYGPVHALDGLDLMVEPGTVFGFLGPNGAGKTTTIRILTGFLTLYIAFYAKAQQDVHSDWTQLVLLGAVGAAAAVGNMLGNGLGTRLELKNPPTIVVWCTAACFVAAVRCLSASPIHQTCTS